MRVLAVVALLLVVAVAVSAVDLDAKKSTLREKRAKQQKLAALQKRLDTLKANDFPRFAEAEMLGWWDDNKCGLCKASVGKISEALVKAITVAPADATSTSICLAVDTVILPACIAIAPGGSVLCPPAVLWLHGKCTDAVDAEFNRAGMAARRAARNLAAADFPNLSAANLCTKLGLC